MKCPKCQTEFEGNICPNCNEPIVNEPTESKVEETVSAPEDAMKQESTNTFSHDIPENNSAANLPEKKKLSKRGMLEVAGCVLLAFSLISCSGKISKSEYNRLQTKYNTLEQEIAQQNDAYEKLSDEYDSYKSKMKPYEKLDKAEAEARQIAADKIIAEKKAAEEKEAAEKKAAEEKAAAEAEPKRKAEESASTEQKNALSTAKNYLSFTAFSYSGLIEQLKYEGYSDDAAKYAADNCGADWNAQAAGCAKNYMDFSSFSRQGLIEQLLYEGFTQQQAEYGASAVGY